MVQKKHKKQYKNIPSFDSLNPYMCFINQLAGVPGAAQETKQTPITHFVIDI